ncbi:MAG TPA: hypothetical protein VL025_16745, partial [Thermoanaerobaculia bacterium]|nr:hypothetical protein [Thermoanaerobaculia bacterium]
MKKPLSPSDLLRRDPSGQAVPLPDGRWLVRGPQGLSLFPPRFARLLPRLLPLLDPPRSLEQIQETLAPESPEDVRGVLESLLGELVQVGPPAEPGLPPEPGRTPAIAARDEVLSAPADPRIVLVANAAAGARIAEGLARAGLPKAVPLPPADLAAGLRGAALAVVGLEDVPYRSLLEVQAACLAAGVPALFLTFDP